MKNIIIAGAIVIFVGLIFAARVNEKNIPANPPQHEETILPTEEDIIRNFFALIQERKISEAVLMMSDPITKGERVKQAWGVQLNAIKSIRLLSIEKSMSETWTGEQHTYKVSLDMTMDTSSANEPIPYYGFENGKNIRWIPLIKSDNQWRIGGIATGP